MPVGFIGVGNMGLPMAEKLIDAGEQLTVHDTRAAAMQPLLERQARAAAGPRAVADQCATVIVSLPTLASLRSVVLGGEGVIQGGHWPRRLSDQRRATRRTRRHAVGHDLG